MHKICILYAYNMHIVCSHYAVIIQSLCSHYAYNMHRDSWLRFRLKTTVKQWFESSLHMLCGWKEGGTVVCDVLATCHRWKIAFDTHNLFLISRPHHTLLGNHIANNITIRSHASLRPELSLRMNKVWVSVHSAQFTTNGRPQVYVLLQDSSPIQVQERFTTSSLQGGHTEEWIS